MTGFPLAVPLELAGGLGGRRSAARPTRGGDDHAIALRASPAEAMRTKE